jgi:aryl-alcohol dehydrogenase-like predicted oxidoreductase
MKYNELGNSGVKVSAITFGAWAIGGWMWGGSDQQDALDAIQTSLDLGITSIDTAPAYGFGLSEELVGKALKGKREQAQILTKYGLRWDTNKGQLHFNTKDAAGNDVAMHKYAGKEAVIRECEESLQRLQTDYIDLYQIHWPDPTTPIEETMEAMTRLLEQGKIRAAGVCNYSVEQLRTADQTVNIVSNQVPYSMVERKIEQELVPYCLEKGKGILAYSPLQRGLLTGKITDEYTFEEGDHRPGTLPFQPQNRRRVNQFLNQIRPIAEEKGATLAQLVINWTIHRPAMAAALVGARDPKQVRENAKALDFTLSTEETDRINSLLEEVVLVAQQA